MRLELRCRKVARRDQLRRLPGQLAARYAFEQPRSVFRSRRASGSARTSCSSMACRTPDRACAQPVVHAVTTAFVLVCGRAWLPERDAPGRSGDRLPPGLRPARQRRGRGRRSRPPRLLIGGSDARRRSSRSARRRSANPEVRRCGLTPCTKARRSYRFAQCRAEAGLLLRLASRAMVAGESTAGTVGDPPIARGLIVVPHCRPGAPLRLTRAPA